MIFGHRHSILVSLVALVAILRMAGAELVPPTTNCAAVRADTPPTIDGQLLEPFWQTAPVYGDFTVAFQDKSRRVQDTSFRVAYDDAWLYLGVDCRNPDMQALAPIVKKHTWKKKRSYPEESVELFIDPGTAGKEYFHYILAFANARDQRRCRGHSDSFIDVPWRSATHIRSDGWSAELAIPLSVLAPYARGGEFRLNVARNRRVPRIDAQYVVGESLESSVWAPGLSEYGGLHEMEGFVPFAGLTLAKPRIPLLARITDAKPRPYFMRDGQNFYALDIEIQSYNATRGDLELIVADRPASGAPREQTQTVAVTSAVLQKLNVEMPVNSLYGREALLYLRAPGQTEILDTFILENLSALNVMKAFLDRNYYTTEKEAVAVAEIALPEDSLKGMKIAVTHEEKVIGQSAATAETEVRFAIADLPPGRHPVTIALKRSDGSTFFAIAADLIKREPKPGREVKIDQINRVVLKDGAPYFPFGPVMGEVRPEDESDFRKIAEAGCNTFFHWQHYGTNNASVFLPVARKYGLQVVGLPEMGWLPYRDAGLQLPGKLMNAAEAKRLTSDESSGSLNIRGHLMSAKASPQDKTAIFGEYFEKNIPLATQAFTDMKDYDNLLAYNSFDEPCENSYFHITKYLNELYNLSRRVDGYHPMMVLYSSHIPEGDEYLAGCDILATDPYWVPARSTVNYVSKIVHWNDQRAAKLRKVVWIVPVGWQWSGITRGKRVISGPEQNCQSFLAIIHGARGLVWFCYPFPELGWANLKETMAMIQVIGPMAVQPQVKQTIAHLRATPTEPEYKAAPFNPEKEEYPDVQGRIFRDPQGGLVLLAANSQYYPVTATFTVSGLNGNVERFFSKASPDNGFIGKFKRLFDRPGLRVKNGVFTEPLEPYAVRAYRLGSALKEPVALTLAAMRPESLPPAETSLRNNVRPGKKNVFPNPSFEEETVPGQPDYYYFYNKNGRVVLDQEQAKFGKKSLKLSIDKDTKINGYDQITWLCAPQHDQATPYVWSFWAKGSKGGEQLWVRKSPEGTTQTFTLTPEWKQYAMPFTLSARAAINNDGAFQIRMWQTKLDWTVWIDGMQLEQGAKATEFEE